VIVGGDHVGDAVVIEVDDGSTGRIVPARVRGGVAREHPGAISKVYVDRERVGLLVGRIVASVMAGYEGHRGWLNYLAVDPEHQRHGLARAIVTEAERLLRDVGCPKINLQIRTSNHTVIEFCRRVGYSTDDVVSMGKRLEHDDKPA